MQNVSNKNPVSVFIDGSAGTTGLRIADRLSARSDIRLLTLSEKDKKDPAARKSMLDSADFSFLCLPDDAAAEAVALCENTNAVIIDASSRHRTTRGWHYGFPELSPKHRENIKIGKRIAVPGCHASGFSAMIYPLTASGILDPAEAISVFSLTGYSGGGKQMIAAYTADYRPDGLASPAPYALGQTHKHLPEMKMVCGLESEPVFVPVVGDFYSGMVVTVGFPIRKLKDGITPSELHKFYTDYYKNESLINVVDFNPTGTDNGFLYANALAGLDRMEIHITGAGERVQISARFCNLGKGASGAAVQCFNIAAGFEEVSGLVL